VDVPSLLIAAADGTSAAALPTATVDILSTAGVGRGVLSRAVVVVVVVVVVISMAVI
jgi:hypothetical protein